MLKQALSQGAAPPCSRLTYPTCRQSQVGQWRCHHLVEKTPIWRRSSAAACRAMKVTNTPSAPPAGPRYVDPYSGSYGRGSTRRPAQVGDITRVAGTQAARIGTHPSRGIEVGDEREQTDLPHRSLADIEWEHIQRVLSATNQNREEAAEILGIGEATLYRRLRERQNEQLP